MDYASFAVSIAQGAGDVLLGRHGTLQTLEWKIVNNFKTESDDVSDAFIRGAIERAFPEHGILSEETKNKVTPSRYVWVVDPLDGTIPYSRFIGRRGINDHFSVSIGLCKDGHPIVGVIWQPLRRELFVAGESRGAFCNDRPIRVSDDDDVHHAIVGGDPGKAPGRTRFALEVEAKLAVDDGVLCITQHGCATVSLCCVADGRMNAYAATRLEPWDMAAAVCISREAGAKVTTLKGKEWVLGDESIFVANPALHAKLLEMLRK